MDVEETVDKAGSFLTKSGYATFKLQSINFDKSKNQWTVKFEIGALFIEYVTVVIDDSTGKIITFERTET
jgi:hypothetical protein